MVKLRCKSACRGGGEPPFCKMRNCCREKGIEGYCQCDEFESCKKLNFLNTVHEDAHIKNLKILRKKDMAEFISGKRYW
jgi:hypothetical protein